MLPAATLATLFVGPAASAAAAAAAASPGGGGFCGAAGPFSDCARASGALAHQYLGAFAPAAAAAMAAVANNQVVDHVGGNPGSFSANFTTNPAAAAPAPAAAAPAAAQGGVSLLPATLGYIPAQYPNGTLSFGVMSFSNATRGVAARLLAAWGGGGAGVLTLSYAGYTVTLTPATVTIANPLTGAAAPFSTPYALPAFGPGFNNQYLTFTADAARAAVFVGGNLIASSEALAFPAPLPAAFSRAAAVAFSAPMALYDVQFYNSSLTAMGVLNMASGQPCGPQA